MWDKLSSWQATKNWLKGGVKDHSFGCSVWRTTDKCIYPSFQKTNDCAFHKPPHIYASTCSSLFQNHQLKCFQQLIVLVILQLTAQPAERTCYRLWLSIENGNSRLVWMSLLIALCASVSLPAIGRTPLTSNLKCFKNAVAQNYLTSFSVSMHNMRFALLLLVYFRVNHSILLFLITQSYY